MSLFADRKYCKTGKGEKDIILGYMAEKGEKKKKQKVKKKQRQRERKKCMDDFNEKNNRRTTSILLW